MSKMQTAIIDLLSTGKWMTSNEIAEEAALPKPYVRVTLTTMSRAGLIIKKNDPNNYKSMVYRRAEIQSGFGVSQTMAEFDRCLQAVRQ